MLVSVTCFLSSIRVQICNVWDITGPAVEVGGWNRLKGMSLFWLHVGMGWGRMNWDAEMLPLVWPQIDGSFGQGLRRE